MHMNDLIAVCRLTRLKIVLVSNGTDDNMFLQVVQRIHFMHLDVIAKTVSETFDCGVATSVSKY